MGTLTITTTAAQDVRILAAFKEKLMLEVNPTQAQVKDWVINTIRSVVIEYEKREALKQAIINVEEFTPT